MWRLQQLLLVPLVLQLLHLFFGVSFIGAHGSELGSESARREARARSTHKVQGKTKHPIQPNFDAEHPLAWMNPPCLGSEFHDCRDHNFNGQPYLPFGVNPLTDPQYLPGFGHLGTVQQGTLTNFGRTPLLLIQKSSRVHQLLEEHEARTRAESHKHRRHHQRRSFAEADGETTGGEENQPSSSTSSGDAETLSPQVEYWLMHPEALHWLWGSHPGYYFPHSPLAQAAGHYHHYYSPYGPPPLYPMPAYPADPVALARWQQYSWMLHNKWLRENPLSPLRPLPRAIGDLPPMGSPDWQNYPHPPGARHP